MSGRINIGSWTILRSAVSAVFAMIANTASGQSVEGTATYRERMALPQSAVFEATLEDASRADAAAETIARTRIASPGNPPIKFTIAAFTASAQPSPPSNASPLEGSSWQLVKFQGGDGKTLTPDDSSKYTIDFDARGQLAARIDCNRGLGTWMSAGPNQVQFGPLALTRAKCPDGSLHDHIVKQWGYIRSYVIKDGHLFLSLMADGGIYEFEPIKESA